MRAGWQPVETGETPSLEAFKTVFLQPTLLFQRWTLDIWISGAARMGRRTKKLMKKEGKPSFLVHSSPLCAWWTCRLLCVLAASCGYWAYYPGSTPGVRNSAVLPSSRKEGCVCDSDQGKSQTAESKY